MQIFFNFLHTLCHVLVQVFIYSAHTHAYAAAEYWSTHNIQMAECELAIMNKWKYCTNQKKKKSFVWNVCGKRIKPLTRSVIWPLTKIIRFFFNKLFVHFHNPTDNNYRNLKDEPNCKMVKANQSTGAKKKSTIENILCDEKKSVLFKLKHFRLYSNEILVFFFNEIWGSNNFNINSMHYHRPLEKSYSQQFRQTYQVVFFQLYSRA